MKPAIVFLPASLLFISLEAQAADLTIRYCKDLTEEQFRRAATAAFDRMGYKIKDQSSGSVVGRSGSATGNAKVEIAMSTRGFIVIRWVPISKDGRERQAKLKYQMLWALASEGRPGVVTINWCKDLDTARFHRVALDALNKRRYTIEKDTPTSLIGAQKKYKVEITMQTPGQILIRWVPGYGYKKDNWLNNLYEDMTWSLARY